MSLHDVKHASTSSTSTASETEASVFHILTGISSPFLPGLLRVPVKDRIWVTKTAQGNVCINEWIIQRTIGRGAYANVRLCHNPLTEQKAAMRMINRTSLRRKLLTQESADKFLWNCSRVMDFLTTAHPSILNLVEVMYHPIYADVCSVESSMEALIPDSVFAGQYAVTPGSLPPWVQTILSIAQQVNLVCELSHEYRPLADQLSAAKGMLSPETVSDLQLLLRNPMAITGATKPPTQGSEFTHRRMPSAGSKLKQYSARSAQLDSNLTPRYQNTGRCTMNYDDNFVFIIEYCDGGTLQEVVRTADLTKIMITFYQVVDALCYMHFCNIVHQDIKLENIILTTDIQNNFKTPVPPASKLLPRRVPRTTDLFFTSTSGAISDFVVGVVPSQSSTPLATTTLSSDPSHSNHIESTVRRDPKDRYNIAPLSLKLPLQSTISTVTNPTAVMHRSPTRTSSHLNDNVLSPIMLPGGSRYRLQSLRESSDITYYLLGDSDTAPYRAKISDFDTAIILEEEGVKLPTAEDVLEALEKIYDKHLVLLRKRFTYLFNELVQQHILSPEDSSLLLHDAVVSLETDCVQNSPREEIDLISSTSSLKYDMCNEVDAVDDLQHSSKPPQLDLDYLTGSVGIYRMSGIYDAQSLDVSETIPDKTIAKLSNPLHKGFTLNTQQVTFNTIGPTADALVAHATYSDKEVPVTRVLQPSCFSLVFSLDDQQDIPPSTLESSALMSLPNRELHMEASQKAPHNDVSSLRLVDLTPDGTGLAQKVCKNHAFLDANIPAESSLLVPAIDCSTKTSNDSLPQGDMLLATISRIEDFIQETIENNKVGQALQSYISSIRQINASPAMPKNTYFISSSTGTPNILSPESRAVIQSCGDHDTHKTRSLFSAVHADAWQTGVMLFHALTGIVRRTPLYRCSQEAFALCGTFGMLITDLLCGLLDEIPSHRYTLFECMYHPAVSPRQFKFPMSIPAKGASDLSMTTMHSVLSHAHLVATSKPESIRALWREARADYYQLRRFHMLIVMRRRQYVLANNRKCLAASTIDNSMIYTSADLPLLTSTLGLFSSKMFKKSKYPTFSQKFYHTDESTAGEKINTHAHIVASEKLKTKTELYSKGLQRSPVSSSDALNRHVSLNLMDSDGCTDTDTVSDTESNASVYITVSGSAEVHKTRKSINTRMINQVFKQSEIATANPTLLSTTRVKHPSLSLMTEARKIRVMLEQILPRPVYERSFDSLPYTLPSFALNERTRNKRLLSIISASKFITESSSAKSLSPRHKYVFTYIRKLLKNYQRSLTLEQTSPSSRPSLKVSLSAPDLRTPSLIDEDPILFEHPLLDTYASMRQGYGMTGTGLKNSEVCALDSILSDSFDNVFHALVNEKNMLHIHNFGWSEKISPLDVYIGSSQNAIEFSLRLLHGQGHDISSFFDLNDRVSLNNLTNYSTLKDVIDKLKRMQVQNVIDGLTTLTVGSSFYELGTKLWYQILTSSFSESLGNKADMECHLKDEGNKLQPGYLFPVAEAHNHLHKLQKPDLSAQSACSSLTDSLESSRTSSPFNQLATDFSKNKLSTSIPLKTISTSLLDIPLSKRTLSGVKLDVQEISEIEHISVTSAPLADRSLVKSKACSQRLNTRTVPEDALQLSVLTTSQSGIASPARNHKCTPNQSPQQEQIRVRLEPSSPVTPRAEAGDTSIASVTSQKSIDLSDGIKSGKELGILDEQMDKSLVSALNDKYVQRNRLYNRAAVSKLFAGIEAQQKQATFKDRESSLEGGGLDAFRDLGTEQCFLHRDELFTRSLEDCIMISQVRKEVKDVGGLTSLFDDSVCTTIDDDNDYDEQHGEHSRNNSFNYEHYNENEHRHISDVVLLRNKHQTRTTGSFSRLRTTSIVTNDNTVAPSYQKQQPVVPLLSALHCSASEPVSGTCEQPIDFSSEYKYLQTPPTILSDIGHGTSQYMCCCYDCARPEAGIQGFNAYRIQLLTAHYRFCYRYKCHISWDPQDLTQRKSSFPKGLFLRRLRTLLMKRVNLPLHWINASIQQELLRWNEFTVKGESSTSAGTPATSTTKSQLRAASPRSPPVIPTLNLQSLPKESAGIKTPITRIRLVNQSDDTTNAQSKDTTVRITIPKLCFFGNNADSAPQKVDAATRNSNTSSSSTSLQIDLQKKTSAIKIEQNVTGVEDSVHILDTSPAQNAPDITHSAPLADLLAIQSAVPSTVHVNKASGIASDDTSIGQCSTDSSDI